LGGKLTSLGLVQVNYNKTWGWVFADQWDKQDGDVACRMMGFDGSLSAFKEKEESKETKYRPLCLLPPFLSLSFLLSLIP